MVENYIPEQSDQFQDFFNSLSEFEQSTAACVLIGHTVAFLSPERFQRLMARMQEYFPHRAMKETPGVPVVMDATGGP